MMASFHIAGSNLVNPDHFSIQQFRHGWMACPCLESSNRGHEFSASGGCTRSGWFEFQQEILGIDKRTGLDMYCPDLACTFGMQTGFHLHGLDGEKQVTCLDI